MKNLVFLRLNNNQKLTNIDALEDLPKLKEVDLRSNAIEKISDNFTTLKGLEKVNLNHNGLSDISGLRDLPKLRELHLFSKLDDLPQTLGTLRTLENLQISAGGGDVTFLASLTSLRELYIACEFDALPMQLGDTLEILTVYRDSGGDDYLESFTSLRELRVSQDRFSMPQLPALESLSIGHADDGIDLTKIATAKSLHTLEIHRTDSMTELPSGISEAKQIRHLELVFLEKLTDLSALSSLDNIQTLKIKYCGALLGLENLGDKNQLVELELDTLPIEDLNILTRFPSLEDLKLTDLEKLVSLPKNLADIKSLKSVYLNDLEELKDISVLEKCEGLAEFECKRSGPSRKAIAKVEASIANGKGESLELRTSYFAFMETMYQTLTGKEDKSHTYDFPLWFDTPETLLDAMEDFSWLDDYLDDDDSELTAILTNPENGLRPLAILDWSFDGCNTDYIDAYSEEIFLVDTESPLNPVLLWGHDSEPREIHKSFDSFLANLRDFELPNEEGTSTTTYLEYVDEKSSKFWKIEIVGNKHIVTYGKIGSAGRTSEKDFDDAESTKKSADKLISSKRKKGYSEP